MRRCREELKCLFERDHRTTRLYRAVALGNPTPPAFYKDFQDVCRRHHSTIEEQTRAQVSLVHRWIKKLDTQYNEWKGDGWLIQKLRMIRRRDHELNDRLSDQELIRLQLAGRRAVRQAYEHTMEYIRVRVSPSRLSSYLLPSLICLTVWNRNSEIDCPRHCGHGGQSRFRRTSSRPLSRCRAQEHQHGFRLTWLRAVLATI